MSKDQGIPQITACLRAGSQGQGLYSQIAMVQGHYQACRSAHILAIGCVTRSTDDMSFLLKSLYVTQHAITVCKVPTHNKGQHEQGLYKNRNAFGNVGCIRQCKENSNKSLYILYGTHIYHGHVSKA